MSPGKPLTHNMLSGYFLVTVFLPAALNTEKVSDIIGNIFWRNGVKIQGLQFKSNVHLEYFLQNFMNLLPKTA